MWFSLIFLLLVIFGYYFYGTYLKEYFEVKKVYDTLQKILDTRDLLLLDLSHDKVDKKEFAKILSLIDKRKETRNSGYTVRMNADVELSNELKGFYKSLTKILDNDFSKELVSRIVELEKQAKKARISYNDAVERYNNNLILHKKVCMRFIHMKPLDTYKI